MNVTPARFLLDTNTVLYLLGGRIVQTFPGGSYLLSVISAFELLAYPARTPAKDS